MLKKLRNRFLMLSMFITSIVMVAAFATIYLTTYNNIQISNQEKLNGVSQSFITVKVAGEASADRPGGNEEVITTVTIEEFGLNQSQEIKENMKAAQFLSPDYVQSFNLEVDKEGNLLEINSIIDMPEIIYEKAAKQAWSDREKNTLLVNLDGKLWQYAVIPANNYFFSGNSGQALINPTEKGYRIAFLDVTESHKTLQGLLVTFLLVGGVMLVVIFFISLYFANRAIRPVAQAWEKQKQFVADASHELKTPLTIITSNYGALLANREETIESQMKWLDYIKIGADRMSKLINDLLLLAKIDGADDRLHNRTFDISNIVQDAAQSMEAAGLAKCLRLSTAIEPGIMVNSDLEKTTQVISILLDNAVKYTNENGWIEVSLAKAKRCVTFSVKNSGKGITKEDLPKVFDRFYRSDQSRNAETSGYGLGLSIAKSLVDKLGGRIKVESVENEYTAFVVTI